MYRYLFRVLCDRHRQTTLKLHNKLTYLDDLFGIPHRGTEGWLVVWSTFFTGLSVQLEQDSPEFFQLIQMDPEHNASFHRGPRVSAFLKWTNLNIMSFFCRRWHFETLFRCQHWISCHVAWIDQITKCSGHYSHINWGRLMSWTAIWNMSSSLSNLGKPQSRKAGNATPTTWCSEKVACFLIRTLFKCKYPLLHS